MLAIYRSFSGSLLLILLWNIVRADAKSFTTFGDFYTQVHDISAYGGVMVGSQSQASDPTLYAVRWTDVNHPTVLTEGEAISVSANGSVVVGTQLDFEPVHIEAFRWNAEGGTQLLGVPTTGDSGSSNGRAVSPDGRYAAGHQATYTVSPGGPTQIELRGRIWPGSYTLQPFSSAATSETAILAIAEGRTEFRYAALSGAPSIGYQPYLYRLDNWEPLGHMPGVVGGPDVITSPTDMTVRADDSSVVVGYGPNVNGQTRAFRWTANEGMLPLGALPTFTSGLAEAISADGSVIVGTNHKVNQFSNNVYSGFYWTAEQGTRSVEAVLQQHGLLVPQFIAEEVTAVSANGLMIAGRGQLAGVPKAWVAQLPQQVGLVWNEDVPVELYTAVDARGKTIVLNRDGTTAARPFLDPAVRHDLRSRAQAIFAESGVENVEFLPGEVPGGINVYITNRIAGSSLLGEALSGVDQFNQQRSGQIVVLSEGNVETDALAIAHEVGHTLGLRHVNPDSSANPSEVMDYTLVAGRTERFLNHVSEITEPPTNSGTGEGISHNPLYHLKHFVDGKTHEDLVAEGILPGDWDLFNHGARPAPAHLESSIEFGGYDRELFDLHVFAGDADENEGLYDQLELAGSMMVSELENLNWDVLAGMRFGLLAASTAGGPLDVMLATGDPFDDENFGVIASPGGVTALLQQITGPGAFSTLATGTLIGFGELAGDYNFNGVVDAADYVTWRDALGQSAGAALAADGDRDRIVDLDDYAIWKNNFGAPDVLPDESEAAFLQAQVPETDSLLLALCGMVVSCVVLRIRNLEAVSKPWASAPRLIEAAGTR